MTVSAWVSAGAPSMFSSTWTFWFGTWRPPSSAGLIFSGVDSAATTGISVLGSPPLHNHAPIATTTMTAVAASIRRLRRRRRIALDSVSAVSGSLIGGGGRLASRSRWAGPVAPPGPIPPGPVPRITRDKGLTGPSGGAGGCGMAAGASVAADVDDDEMVGSEDMAVGSGIETRSGACDRSGMAGISIAALGSAEMGSSAASRIQRGRIQWRCIRRRGFLRGLHTREWGHRDRRAAGARHACSRRRRLDRPEERIAAHVIGRPGAVDRAPVAQPPIAERRLVDFRRRRPRRTEVAAQICSGRRQRLLESGLASLTTWLASPAKYGLRSPHPCSTSARLTCPLPDRFPPRPDSAAS